MTRQRKKLGDEPFKLRRPSPERGQIFRMLDPYQEYKQD